MVFCGLHHWSSLPVTEPGRERKGLLAAPAEFVTWDFQFFCSTWGQGGPSTGRKNVQVKQVLGCYLRIRGGPPLTVPEVPD